ncbi:protein-L-histidine N-pros-methyltransferase [Bacillus rossius redtenbacheri]|uniref:protein-L-histidine N-pros-methyltransferase n=1 Tax=Bacillus rossius redtenbacheri TaxID=93214 RepID=UPI002FDE7A3B
MKTHLIFTIFLAGIKLILAMDNENVTVNEDIIDIMHCENESYNQQSVESYARQNNRDPIYRPHGTLARTLYNKYLADERLQNYDRRKWYAVDPGRLPPTIASLFLQLSADQETEQFLEQATEKSDWVLTQLWHSLARSFLGLFMTQTSINGLLGRGSMFVFSLEQFRLLLGGGGGRDHLLDLGAGDGRTTQVMAPLFAQVSVTEVSGPMRSALVKKGFRLVEVDEWARAGARYDVITCLNLLDRCDRPLSLLRDLRAALRPGGRALMALVLPFSPYLETGAADHRPAELLPVRGEGFEQQAASLVQEVLPSCGLAVERWSRVPYLCEGDLNQAFYWLDDAVFVLRAS